MISYNLRGEKEICYRNSRKQELQKGTRNRLKNIAAETMKFKQKNRKFLDT